MSFVAAGLTMGAGAAMGMGGSIFGGLMGSSAEKKRAAAMQAAGNEGADAILKGIDLANAKAGEFNQTARGDLSPFRQFGVDAGNTLTNLLFGGGDVSKVLQASPLFQFQSKMGAQNINRELAARGLYGSGAGLQTLQQFNDQLVGEEGQRLVDRLFNLTNLGANSANSMAQLTTQTGGSMADRIFGGRNAAAQLRYDATVGAANARSNAQQMIGQMGQSVLQQGGNFLANLPMMQSNMGLNNAIMNSFGSRGLNQQTTDPNADWLYGMTR